MHPETDAVDPSGGTPAPADRPREDRRGNLVCWVCQQPLDRDVEVRLRGEPVHHRCWVELKCGIAVGERETRTE